MKNIIFLIFFQLLISKIDAQEFKHCYITAEDVLNNTPYEYEVEPVFKVIEDQCVKISKFQVPGSSKKDKLANEAWAIQIDEDIYINFKYADELHYPGLFVKASIVGRFCAVLIHPEDPDIISEGGKFYPYNPILSNQSRKNWKTSWKNEFDDKMKIIVFDTEVLINRDGIEQAHGYLLDMQNFNNVLNLFYKKKDLKNISFENIITLILELNKE